MAAQRGPGESAGSQQFTISYAGYNRPWAAWISHRLQRLGHRPVLRRWDGSVDQPLESALADLLDQPGKTLLILSDWYFSLGPRTEDEWNAALHAVVEPHTDRFAAVSVTTRQLPNGTGLLAPADLWRIGAEESERRVLGRLGLPTEGPYIEDERPGTPRFPDDPPAVWGPVPRRNPRFTGRDTLLSALHDWFEDAPSGAAVCALHGMSGVGKTQLGSEYAHRFASDYDLVWWVPAHTRAAMREGLAALAPALGLVDAGSEYGERIRAVHEALRIGSPHSRWLLVFDGADDPAAVADAVPSGPGHVLITTRNRDWGGHDAELMDVPVYARDESVAFVRRRAGRLSPAEAHLLAAALDDLPLLLDQTAGWLGQSAMPVEEYVALVSGSVSDSEDVLQTSPSYPEAFPKAWDILLNTLRENMQEAVDLLRLCVFFAPGPVPLRLLREMGAGRLPERLSWLTSDTLKWNRALKILIQYAVVRIEYQQAISEDAGTGVETVQMHRMVHGFVRDTMSDREHTTLSRVVQESLAAADPGRSSDSRLWPRYAELVPHLESCGALDSDDPKVQRFVLNCLRYLYQRGEFRTGLELSEKVRVAWTALLGADHGQLIILSHHQANMLRMLGRYREAEALSRTAVDQLSSQDEPDELELLKAMSGLAANVMARGRYPEAQGLLETVWERYRELLGDDEPRTLSSRNNVNVVLRLRGRYQEALDLDRDSLEAHERVLRTLHPSTLGTALNYAWGLRLLGRYTEATSRQELGVRLHLQVLGRNHPQTLMAQHNLAMCMRRQDMDLSASEALLGSTLERSERVLGRDNPGSLRVACDYASLLRAIGTDLGDARRRAEDVAARYTAAMGAEHPFAIGAYGNVALVLREAGERQEAFETAERALSRMREAMGEDHPWTLGCALNAASCRNLIGRVDDAAELSRDTLARARRVLGGQHPLTLSCEVGLAADLRGLGQRDEADKLEHDALQQLSRTLGAQHRHTVAARTRIRPFWDFEPQPV
ncbi:FxSxx-COOH system tetratricopeptide repeat protein [Streptomyces sp. NPDC050610]|uniref:FxSxx-COOH system tetratricopeptide repeat protein n=1 Tax=Streptomyces sp. NPDC050610 TaxID=3157097 RepID=UPI00342AF41E